MPRPDKRIVPGQDIGAPARGARAHVWTKYDGAATVDDARATPTTIEVTVDDVTVVQDLPLEEISKFDQRGTAAHVPVVDAPVRRITERRKEWRSERGINGRSYHRTDTAVFIEVEVGP